MIVDIQAFNKLVSREAEQRDRVPEHTLDWYTYNNRVDLLNEVRGLFEELPEIQAVITAVRPTDTARDKIKGAKKQAAEANVDTASE